MKTKSITFTLLICVLFSSFSPLLSFGTLNQEDDIVYIEVLSPDSTIDLTGITINIYSAVLVQEESNDVVSRFNEEYYCSVSTQANGSASFVRPSVYFSYSVDLDTLPYGCGVTPESQFISNNDSSIELYVDYICSADFLFAENRIELYCKNNRALFANARFTDSTELVNENTAISNEQSLYEGELNIKHCVSIYAYDKIFYKEYTTSHQYNGEYERAQLLADYNLTFEEKPDYTSDSKPKNTETLNLQQNRDDEDDLDSIHVITNNQRFNIVFPISISDDIYEIAAAVGNEFVRIHNRFCNTWNFRIPFTDYYYESGISHSYFKIRIVPDNVYGAARLQTNNVTTGSTYIELSITYASSLYCQTDDSVKGSCAHEYMHAIQHMYMIYGNTLEREWFCESFASWAGLVYESAYESHKKSHIIQYLNSPSKNLPYFDSNSYNHRHYGTCIYPLYLYENLGGALIIKQIYEECEQLVDPNDPSSFISPLLAIRNVLNEYFSSNCFNDSFGMFAAYNCAIKYFYDHISLSAYDNIFEKLGNHSGFPVATSNTTTNDPLSSRYIRFWVSNDTPLINSTSKLAVTITKYSNSGDSNFILKSIVKDSSGDYTVNNHTTYSGYGRYTVVYNNFGTTSNQETILMIANSGLSNTVSFKYSANIVYEPSYATYKIRNVGSGKYLTVQNTLSLVGKNVYQYSSIIGNDSQKFMLYPGNNSFSNYYRLSLTYTSLICIDIEPFNGYISAGCNVITNHTNTSSSTQYWQFIEIEPGQYRLAPYYNTALTLASVGDDNGSPSGSMPTSPGNVIVNMYSYGNDYFLWTLEPVTNST